MSVARPLIAAGLLAGVALAAGTASAQTIYRIVGPDGKVTFSDKPPPDPKANVAPARAGSAAPAGGNVALPTELRNVANKYPVTLYAGPQCDPCGAARAFLNSRGIPFAERTVSSNEDIEALQRLSGANSLPFMTIGGQHIKGYSDAEYAQFLDAAGYPRQSQLPQGYRNPAPTPLVAVSAPPAPAPGTQAEGEQQPRRAPRAAAPAPAPAPAVNPNNPAGITF